MHKRWSQLEGLKSDRRWFVLAAKRREQITGARADKNVQEWLANKAELLRYELGFQLRYSKPNIEHASDAFSLSDKFESFVYNLSTKST